MTHATIGPPRLRLLWAALLCAAASPAAAQDISQRLTTALAGRPYQPTYVFFTAQGSEAFLNLSHVDGRCISTTSCSTTPDCTATFPGSVCAGSPLRCQVPVDVLVGQVAVVEKTPFCEVAACAGVSFPECAGVVCPAGQTYCGSPGNCHTCPMAEDLCLCDGGAMCEEPDAVVALPGVSLVDGFADGANPRHWHLAGASIDPLPADSRLVVGPGSALAEGASASVASVRFHVVPGQAYVVFLKRAVNPRASWAECNPFSHLSLYVTSRPPRWCDQDEDGSASNDCDDTNPNVYPGAPEINDGLDNQCPGDPGFGVIDEISGFAGYLTAGDDATFSWPAQSGATSYEAVRSPYRDFHAGCVRQVTAGTSWTDSTTPPPGGVLYYLVRAAAPTVGSWGQRSSGAERTICAGCENTGHWCDDGSACTTDSCQAAICVGTVPGAAAHLVVSQVQTAGDGADDEFIEIYNPSSSAVSLGGLSIQYKPATTSTFLVHVLGSASIPAHGFFLIARSAYNGPTTPDQLYSAFLMSATGGHVFLVASTSLLSGSCPAAGPIIDTVGYGSANCPEGAAASAPPGNDSILRKPGGGCGSGVDSGSNASDFLIRSPATPRNSASPAEP